MSAMPLLPIQSGLHDTTAAVSGSRTPQANGRAATRCCKLVKTRNAALIDVQQPPPATCRSENEITSRRSQDVQLAATKPIAPSFATAIRVTAELPSVITRRDEAARNRGKRAKPEAS
jgi:hypothetical protein